MLYLQLLNTPLYFLSQSLGHLGAPKGSRGCEGSFLPVFSLVTPSLTPSGQGSREMSIWVELSHPSRLGGRCLSFGCKTGELCLSSIFRSRGEKEYIHLE